ncbi:3-isopropylmalate dehydrogenase [Ascosphaera pollenicola]|nr:3-isopropylmalate dehydrogenase [Ascosphaera pollenicola]
MPLNRRSLRSEAVNMLNSLDFSWQHVTYKTLASVWVLFVFYLSWLLLPEVSAIFHGLGNGNGTAGGARGSGSRGHNAAIPSSSPDSSLVQTTAVTAAAGGEPVEFSVIGTPFMLMQETCLDFELLRGIHSEHGYGPSATATYHDGDRALPHINGQPSEIEPVGSRVSL